MAPERGIYPDQVQDIEDGIRGLGGRVILSSFTGQATVWSIPPSNELVHVVVHPSGRSAKIEAGISGAEVLEKAGVIDFSQSGSIGAVEASRPSLQ